MQQALVYPRLVHEVKALRSEILATVPRLAYSGNRLIVHLYDKQVENTMSPRNWTMLSNSASVFLYADRSSLGIVKTGPAQFKFHFYGHGIKGKLGPFGLTALLNSLRALDVPLDDASRAALHQFLEVAAQLA